jgi:hypothetical protein
MSYPLHRSFTDSVGTVRWGPLVSEVGWGEGVYVGFGDYRVGGVRVDGGWSFAPSSWLRPLLDGRVACTLRPPNGRACGRRRVVCADECRRRTWGGARPPETRRPPWWHRISFTLTSLAPSYDEGFILRSAKLKFGWHSLIGMCLVFATFWLIIFYSQYGPFVRVIVIANFC